MRCWNRLRSTPPGKTTSRTVKSGARGIARQDERVVLVAQETGRSAAEFLVDRVAELNIRRHRFAIAQLSRDHRPVSRIRQGRVERMSRQHVGVGHSVRSVLGVPRPKDRVLVLVLRQLGKRVAERDPGNVGRNRPELAPDLLGRLGLGVKAVDVADAALQPEQDARDILACLSDPRAPAAPENPAGTIPRAASEPTLSNSRRVTRSQLRCKPIVKLSIAPSPGIAPQGSEAGPLSLGRQTRRDRLFHQVRRKFNIWLTYPDKASGETLLGGGSEVVRFAS